ncbi:MAG TPA: sulfotransferase [Steroidobacteraceae bacterium]
MSASAETGRRLPRVVQVGFNKCGTRSFQRLFERAGHPVVQHKIRRPFRRSRKAAYVMQQNLRAGRPVFAGMEDYVLYAGLIHQTATESFEGVRHFREMLRDYPDTILILNVRDREDWIRSRLKHGRGELVRRVMRQRGVSTPEEVAAIWRREWDEHLADVREAMKDRPAQLIEFNLDTDPVQGLIDRLPGYGLEAADWGDVGRTRGVREHPLVRRFKRWWAHARFRPDT